MRVRYYGHVGVPTGYGEAAAETCMAILSAGHELEISTDGQQLEARYLPLALHFRNESDLSSPDVVIVHTLPLDCAKVLERARIRESHPRALCVAYTTWEGASRIPPEMATSLAAFDQVWVPSRVTSARMFCRVGDPVVKVIPHAFDASLWDPARGMTAPTDKDTYRFLYVGAWAVRKNVEGIIHTYLRTFSTRDNVELVIQSSGATESACRVAQVTSGLGDVPTPTIRFSSARMPREQLIALHRECHTFVTASRGEAWNMPAFDALLARRHMLVPGGHGSDDFLQETSAELYGGYLAPARGEVRLVASGAPHGHAAAVYMGNQGLTVKSDWREPDLSELGVRMREAYRRRTAALSVHYDPIERFGRAHVGRLITRAMEGS